MLSLAEVRRLMDGPAPPATDPGVYEVLRAVWRTYPLAGACWREVLPGGEPAEARWANLRNGQPLLDPASIRWDAGPLTRQVRRLRRVLRSATLESVGPVRELRDLLALGDDEAVACARRFFSEDVEDGRPELLVGGWVLQPFLYAFARRVHSRLSGTAQAWSRCPVCGGRACHGYLDAESRKKVLICARCLCPWGAPRLECPFCGNTSQGLLGYYYDEGAPGRRIEFCGACRSLLPVTLEPASGSPFPLLDHLASIPLRAAVERSTYGDQPS